MDWYAIEDALLNQPILYEKFWIMRVAAASP